MTTTGLVVSSEAIDKIGALLSDKNAPLKKRFRALFTLRHLGGDRSIDWIARNFDDPSALLKHELAYCLGQMGNPYAAPFLRGILEDETQEPMVRHEAGEALGALGGKDDLPLLEKYSKDPFQEQAWEARRESLVVLPSHTVRGFDRVMPNVFGSFQVAETCELAVHRIKWFHEEGKDDQQSNSYLSTDPTPPLLESDVTTLKAILLDAEQPLWKRYRAMFALRNMGTDEAVLAIAEGLNCEDSALFRHEIAFVLGQLQSPLAIDQLTSRLTLLEENCMVRHECAEALGAIATEECRRTLERYVEDRERVVRESCEVALDMCGYENSEEFQYANGLSASE